MGRRSLLTEEIQEAIITALRNGHYMDDAANLVGISEHTAYNWIARGRKASEETEQGIEPAAEELKYLRFFQSVKAARSEAIDRNLTVIRTAAQDGSWQASAWYLERTNPQKWGRRDTVALTGAEGQQVSVEISPIDTLREKLQAMEERALQIVETQGRELPSGEQ
jgi:hypothetical protein